LADVRATIEISDPVLSEQSAELKVRTGYAGERPRTWLSLTPSARAAYTRHIEPLRGIAGGTP
jgi:hypothetical protein